MHGLVERFGGQIIQQQYRRVVAGEVMLDGQNLPTITQGALRQQANFRQAVDHHPRWLDALDHLKDVARGFAKLQVRGVEQTLMMIAVEQVLGRGQFEDVDFVRQFPAVRRCAFAELVLGFGQSDVQRHFTQVCPCLEELKCYGCLAGSGFAFEKENMIA